MELGERPIVETILSCTIADVNRNEGKQKWYPIEPMERDLKGTNYLLSRYVLAANKSLTTTPILDAHCPVGVTYL